MIHANSHAAFEALSQSGVLTQQAEFAVREILARGPGTSREIDARVGHGGRGWQPVLHTLHRRGVLTVTHSRRCAVSGETAMVYEYTGASTAAALPMKPSRKERLRFLRATAIPGDPQLADIRARMIAQLEDAAARRHEARWAKDGYK